MPETRVSPAGYLAATIAVVALSAAIYAWTAAPGLLFADSGEFQTVALFGGIAHSTGYPGFTLFFHALAPLLTGDRAGGVTLINALLGALDLGLLMLVLRELRVSAVAAASGALAFGLTFSFWRATQRAEVYTLGCALPLLGLWLALRWNRGRRLADALGAGLAFGLTLTVHLSFAVPIAIGGLALAWSVFRTVRPPWLALLSLLAAFAIGLAPYAYIPWADTHHAAANFLDLVAKTKGFLGLTQPPFETPWDRLVWLTTGRNYFPPKPFSMSLNGIFVNLVHCGVIQFCFEMGPVAGVLMGVGLIRMWGTRRLLAATFALTWAASILFAAALQFGPMLHLFQLPALLLSAVFLAIGLDRVFGAVAERVRSPLLIWAIALLAVPVIALPPAMIRVATAETGLFTDRFRVFEEDRSLNAGLVPSMHGFREPERYTRAALAVIPDSSLVLAGWAEFTTIRYLRMAEGARADLTLELSIEETSLIVTRRWLETHDPALRPVAYTWFGAVPPETRAFVDSLDVETGRKLYVLRRSPWAVAADSAAR